MSSQEKNMVIGAINYLINLNILSYEDANVLRNYYLNDSRVFDVIKDEIIKLSNDKVYREEMIANIKQYNIEKSKAPVIVSIDDFKKDGKSYIKLKYSDNSIKLVLNNFGKSGKEVFELVSSKYSGEATKVYEKMLQDTLEVKLYDFSDVNNKSVYDSLGALEKQSLYLVLTDYNGKKVICAPSDFIYIVLEDGKDDLVLQVDSKNGVYQVRQIGLNENDDNVFTDIDEIEENAVGSEKGKQKRLGTSPLSGGFSLSEDNDSGFMNILFFIFLTGIGVGVIGMIILNVLMK